jgi:aconitate hydratase
MTRRQLVTAMAFSGRLDFDPTTEAITTSSGESFRFSSPKGSILPPNEYVRSLSLYAPPPKDRENLQVNVDPASDRIQLVEPFKPWDGADRVDLKMLIKVQGKCSEYSGTLMIAKDFFC